MAKTALTLRSIFDMVDRVSGPVRTMTGNVGKSTKEMSALFSRTTDRARSIGAALKGAAFALTTGAVAKALTNFAEQGDAIARNASIIGLSTTAYQELAFAAKLADIESEDFAAAIKKMNVNVGQLRMKEGALYTTLAKVNPKLAIQLRDAKSSDEAFGLLADTLAKETNAQKRATLAVAAFGKSGQALIPMFRDLAKVRQEAQDSGGVMSPEQIRAAEDLDDTLKRLRISMTGIKNAGLSAIAEAAEPYLADLAKWLKENKGTITKDIKELFGLLADGGKLVADGWNSGLIPTVLAAVAAFKGLKGAVAVGAALKALPFAASAVAGGAATIAEGAAMATGAGAAAGAGAGLVAAPVIAGGAMIGLAESANARRMAAARARGDKYTGGSFGAQLMTAYQGAKAERAPMSPTAAMVQSSSTVTNRSEVVISLPALPEGARVRQHGDAPGVSLKVGRQMQPASGGSH